MYMYENSGTNGLCYVLSTVLSCIPKTLFDFLKSFMKLFLLHFLRSLNLLSLSSVNSVEVCACY